MEHADDDLQEVPSALRRENAVVLGTLTLHTAFRDICWALDGDTAMRVLGSLRTENMAAMWSTSLDPLDAQALQGWLLWNDEAVIAARWAPDGEATRANALSRISAIARSAEHESPDAVEGSDSMTAETETGCAADDDAATAEDS